MRNGWIFMAQIYDITEQLTYKMAMRQYRVGGPVFLFKISKMTGDILSSERLEEIPSNWPKEYVDSLIENGKVLESVVFNDSH